MQHWSCMSFLSLTDIFRRFIMNNSIIDSLIVDKISNGEKKNTAQLLEEMESLFQSNSI